MTEERCRVQDQASLLSDDKAVLRSYQIPVSRDCSQSCSYCNGIGARSDEKANIPAFQCSLSKAEFGQYYSILLPCNFLFLENFQDYLDELHSRRVRYTVRVNTCSSGEAWRARLAALDNELAQLDILIDGYTARDQECLEFLATNDLPRVYTLVLRNNQAAPKIISDLPKQITQSLRLMAPHKLKRSDPFLSNRDLFRTLRIIELFEQEYTITPAQEADLFEPRVPWGMELEPELRPIMQTCTPEPDIQVSVVIPTYNNEKYVLNTLQHLLRQDLASRYYEIIIVDDGSSDPTQSTLSRVLGDLGSTHNVKLLYFPRSQPRKMGDGQFRAGIARNLGVKNAVGELLVFLDSDILTPVDYLSQLLVAHEQWDLVQTERIYLRQSTSNEHTSYECVDFDKDTYIPSGNYWEQFYRSPTPWNDIPFGWKYVCTYGLSVKRETFQRLGWFKKNYIFYGFEDTDFGYRAMKAGLRFLKSELKCLHLYHETERSEFSNSEYLRYELLKKTARILFHNQLDTQVYEHFQHYVDDGLSLRELVFRLRKFLMKSSYIRR
jgi:glycosyltransferase involved in cell wall biosynthesis